MPPTRVDTKYSKPPLTSCVPSAARRQQVRDAAGQLPVVALLGIGRVEVRRVVLQAGRDAGRAARQERRVDDRWRWCRRRSAASRSSARYCAVANMRGAEHAAPVGDEQPVRRRRRRQRRADRCCRRSAGCTQIGAVVDEGALQRVAGGDACRSACPRSACCRCCSCTGCRVCANVLCVVGPLDRAAAEEPHAVAHAAGPPKVAS